MGSPPEEPRSFRKVSQASEIHRGRRFVVTRLGAPGSPDRIVIEKTVEPDHRDEAAVAALIHEAAVLKRVEAPGVERLVALRTEHALPVLVVEDAGSTTLRERMRRPFEVEGFLEVALRLAEIVGHVHSCDVIHGDINPSNIVVDAHGEPTLVDFDRAAAGSSSLLPSVDEPGGEPPLLPYAAPEQLGRAKRAVDCRSDLYSLGAISTRC